MLVLLLAARSAPAGEIRVSYPAEGAPLPPLRSTFIFGSVSPSTAPFFINGSKVSVHRNGGFIAYLPVSEGDFAFKCELTGDATAYYSRKVKIRPGPKAAPPGTLRLELVSPAEDIALPPGELLEVRAEGTPGRTAVFGVSGLAKDVPMAETPPGSGNYYGTYRIKDSDQARSAPLEAKFRSGLFAATARSRSAVRVSVMDTPELVETSTDPVILRNGLGSGYMMFLPKGVRLLSDAKSGRNRRIRLSSSETGWTDESKVAVSTDVPPYAPQYETGTIRLKSDGDAVSASIAMPAMAPYTVEERENSLRLTLYYTRQHTNWVIYDSSDTFIKQVRFAQTGESTMAVDFEYAPGFKLGGYDVYPGTRAMVVELRRMPSVAGVWPRPLAGLRVVVDPGHSPKTTPPFDGAIGPTGTFEYQVNLMTSNRLRDSLSALGATVYMTRAGEENVPLGDRPKLARDFKGDIFISMHNNAIADGEDPFSQPRGFSIYHYHRHSLDLAAAVHRAYLKSVPLPDEGLRYGDYAVARMTYMPAILVESAYMILPEQEELLNTPAFQQKLADAVTAGVLGFFKIQPPPAAKKRKS